jgi:RecJ-like exonuclease
MLKDNEMKCNKCEEVGYLIVQTTVADYICEACGEWQDFTLNSAYYPEEVSA